MLNIILFHILFLSLLEIIFYFEYIGPLETEIFKNTFKNLIKHYDKEYKKYENNYENQFIIINKNDPSFNFTIGDSNYIGNNQNSVAKKDREEFNKKLYERSMLYWFIFLSFVLLVALIKLCYDYYKFKNKNQMNRVDSNSSIELRNMDLMLLRNTYSNNLANINNQQNITQDIENNDSLENNFIDYGKIKKLLLKKSIFYFLLGGFILLFEYLFFNNIVLNYKVLSNEEIINMLHGSIDSLILNYIITNRNMNN